MTGAKTLAIIIPMILVFFIAGFLIVISQALVEDVQSTVTTDGYADNASTDILTGMDKISGFQPTIGLIVAAVAVIAVLMTLLLVVGVKKFV